jgi:hypothetical protein
MSNNEEIVKELSTNLTISDMKVINNIIQLASARGLFKPSEFIVVGSIFEKINSIIATVNNESN